ncbi:MAG: hypothetical protein IJA69_01750, partial [Clostridia bacterium]|nr:hypothetical protein [Clostridia bacterium]
MIIEQLTKEQADIFEKYFLENGKFNFEGCWLRNQRPENAKKSGYIDETTQRRRFVHFYDTYTLEKTNDKFYLNLQDYYLYVTNTLPKHEVEEYHNKIVDALTEKGYEKIDESYYLDNTQVDIKFYDVHPQNTTTFPSDYISIDVVICSKGYNYAPLQQRMWDLSRKNYRIPEKRGNPTYPQDVADIIKYLPAQIEMGCGPSIEANIPPLYGMHETYKVQNHITGKFYFSNQDDLILSVIQNPEKMRAVFAHVPLCCIRASHTKGYEIFNELYQKGYFVGEVYNNNFDKLLRRFGIKENYLRNYDIKNLFAKTN